MYWFVINSSFLSRFSYLSIETQMKRISVVQIQLTQGNDKVFPKNYFSISSISKLIKILMMSKYIFHSNVHINLCI